MSTSTLASHDGSFGALARQSPSAGLLWLVAGAFAWGAFKAGTVRQLHGGCQPAPPLAGMLAGVASEELGYRVGIPSVLAVAGLSPQASNLVSAALFGLGHLGDAAAQYGTGWGAFRIADAAAGGMLYSSALSGHGLVGALATHVAHNLGVYWAGRCRGS